MHVPVRARPAGSGRYAYPEHLRPQIANLPRAPGAYMFHGDGDALLYIGKSVDIRSRVLAHMRTPDEACLLRQSRRITYTRTAGDLGARLLEARLVKLMQPLYNRKLRRTRNLFSIRLLPGRPVVVSSRELRFAAIPGLHGLFSSRTAALRALRAVADGNRLCYGLLGIEKVPPGRPCFRATIGRCAGACCGRESVAEHGMRLEAALQKMRVETWPHGGAIGIVERGADMVQIHVVRDWHYLGSAAGIGEARMLDRVAEGFDGDGYRILVKPVLSGTYELLPL
jgi:excinuclease Cho